MDVDVVHEAIALMVVGFNVGSLVVVGAKVVEVVGLGFIVEVVSDSSFFVFLLLLSFLVFVFEVSFSALRFHHFLFYCIRHLYEISR